MSKLRCHITISLDGFVAGPNQSEENPLGEGGERLHVWMVPLAAWRESNGEQGGEVNESTRIFEESRENVGAGVMGRNMFGPVHGGAWGDEHWTGWWGDNPPYHYPAMRRTAGFRKFAMARNARRKPGDVPMPRTSASCGPSSRAGRSRVREVALQRRSDPARERRR